MIRASVFLLSMADPESQGPRLLRQGEGQGLDVRVTLAAGSSSAFHSHGQPPTPHPEEPGTCGTCGVGAAPISQGSGIGGQ